MKTLNSFKDLKHIATPLTKEQIQAQVDAVSKIAPRPTQEIMPFGKYKGMAITDVYEVDSKYLDWVVDQDWCRPKLKEIILGLKNVKA